jgi:hypothetical protein
MESDQQPRRGFLWAAAVAAVGALVPFMRMLWGGYAFYFRDLSGQFLPVRRFILDGVALGEWRFWNPLVHEGEPLVLSPFGYLPDLLQLLRPDEFGISLSLALHIPFAAVSFVLLAHDLKLRPSAATAGGLIYALGGFALSSINLYFYVQTLAWAPIFLLGFRRAVTGEGGRIVALGALATGMMISTAGVEIIIQAGLLAILLSPPASRRQWGRAAGTLLLGIGLAATVVAPLIGLGGSSQRAAGFPTAVVLSNSVSPLSFFQVLIAGFFGDPSNLSERWWGVNFFPNGFPYFLSLYLGPAVLSLALAGVFSKLALSRRLALAVALGVFACLGESAGWAAFFDLSPALRFLRFPVKAFFTVHFAIALLSAFGVHAMTTGDAGLKKVAWIAMALGAAVASIRLLPILAPAWVEWFLSGFLPPGVSTGVRAQVADFVPNDAMASGIICLLVAFLAVAAWFGRLPHMRAVYAIIAIVAADLIRAGAGLNQSVTPRFYDVSPGMSRHVEDVRTEGRRYFVCHTESASSYWAARQAMGPRHAWSMAMVQETLTPPSNSSRGVRSALSPDTTGVTPPDRALPLSLANCSRLDLLLPRLRNASVTRLLSLDPMSAPDLRLLDVVTPERIAPLAIHVYELSGALPRFSLPVAVTRDVPGHLRFSLASASPVQLVVREPFANGWSASINGAPGAIVRRADGYQELSLPAGEVEVRLDYRLPGFSTGASISAVSILICLALLVSPRARPVSPIASVP